MSTAYLYDPVYMEHRTGRGHPEKPERLAAIDASLSSAPYYQGLVRISPVMPDRTHIEAIHSQSYIARVEKEIRGGIACLDSPDTPVSRESFEVALLAVGGSLAMCDAVMGGAARNGFCAIRPPGHHAERDSAAGFCIFNNIAIAARYLQNQHDLARVAIVDWDVHHGNGTQHSFERDRSVLYISTHQHPHYPGTGSAGETGIGEGAGYTLNIPMRSGSGDAEYRDAFSKKIKPLLESFAPEIILISAGFDAHRADPLSGICLSSDAFAEMTRILSGIADRYSGGRIIAFLEGGYNTQSLAESVRCMMDVLVAG